MKKLSTIQLVAIFIFIAQHCLFGQVATKISRLHNGTSSFYANLNVAIDSSLSGDTLYLPGGAVPATGTITIDKTLTIVGAGINPDSSAATQVTALFQTFRVITGADNGFITGIKFNNPITFGNNSANSANVNNYRFERCYFLGTISIFGTGVPQNIYYRENVINANISSSNLAYYSNNIFYYTHGDNNSVYFNNIMYTINSYYDLTWNSTTGSTFCNNIFIKPYDYHSQFYLGNSNEFINNLFCNCEGDSARAYLDFGQSNTYISNIEKKLTSGTFVNAPGCEFSFSNDYHLQETSPGHNYGTDGTDVGIYGTSAPFKATPFNPHIISKSIDAELSPTGKLGVEVSVSAQDR